MSFTGETEECTSELEIFLLPVKTAQKMDFLTKFILRNLGIDFKILTLLINVLTKIQTITVF